MSSMRCAHTPTERPAMAFGHTPGVFCMRRSPAQHKKNAAYRQIAAFMGRVWAAGPKRTVNHESLAMRNESNILKAVSKES